MDEAKISILYAEDDEFGAKLTKTILEKENFEVEIVSDGSEAWKAYKERKPDILLLDLDMPGKDGLEITRLVREHDQQTPILVYTTHGEPAKEVAVLDAGADEPNLWNKIQLGILTFIAGPFMIIVPCSRSIWKKVIVLLS